MAAVRLTEGEVHRRVSSYADETVTDSLFQFGQILIAANRDRTKQLETKALSIAGYGVAVLALLASREPVRSVIAPWPPNLIAVASVCAALALLCAGAALVVRSHAWFSDTQWFESENGVLNEPDSLRRCHVLAMHAVNRKMTDSNDWKANNLIAAQWFLLVAALCLLGWLAGR